MIDLVNHWAVFVRRVCSSSMVQFSIEKESRSKRAFCVAARVLIVLIGCLFVGPRVKFSWSVFQCYIHQAREKHSELEVIKGNELPAIGAAVLERVAVTMPILCFTTSCRKDDTLIVGVIFD